MDQVKRSRPTPPRPASILADAECESWLSEAQGFATPGEPGFVEALDSLRPGALLCAVVDVDDLNRHWDASFSPCAQGLRAPHHLCQVSAVSDHQRIGPAQSDRLRGRGLTGRYGFRVGGPLPRAIEGLPGRSGRRRASCGRCRPRRRAGRAGRRRRPSRWRTSVSRASRSPGATSNTSSSWTCSSIRERRPAAASARVDAEHGDLDDVGGRALDRRVERHPLGHLAALPVVAGEVGQVAAAAQDRLGVAVAAGLVDDDRRGSRAPRRTARSTRPSGRAPRRGVIRSCCDEAERRQAVGEAVVHRLDLGAAARG